jgi:hypothetical protein
MIISCFENNDNCALESENALVPLREELVNFQMRPLSFMLLVNGRLLSAILRGYFEFAFWVKLWYAFLIEVELRMQRVGIEHFGFGRCCQNNRRCFQHLPHNSTKRQPFGREPK